MAFLDKMFGSTANNLANAMDLASRRQSLLMNNLANVNVPGYKRQDLDFRITLEQELGSRSGTIPRTDSASIRVDGNSVDLEREVAAIAETELRYNALTELTQRYFSGLRNVIREGR